MGVPDEFKKSTGNRPVKNNLPYIDTMTRLSNNPEKMQYSKGKPKKSHVLLATFHKMITLLAARQAAAMYAHVGVNCFLR